MSLTQGQARHLAAFIATLRDDWDERGIYVALGRCREQRAANVALAAIRCADDPNAETPGAIPNPNGPHWSERRGDDRPFHPPTRREACLLCGRHIDRCLCDRPTTCPTPPTTDPTAHAARARAALRTTDTEETP